jgi:hypothetical protein
MVAIVENLVVQKHIVAAGIKLPQLALQGEDRLLSLTPEVSKAFRVKLHV